MNDIIDWSMDDFLIKRPLGESTFDQQSP